MTINPNEVLKDYASKNAVIRDMNSDGTITETPMTVKAILVRLLVNHKTTTLDETMRCHRLATRLWEGDETTLVAEDVVLLRKMIPENPEINNMIKGRLLEILEEKPNESSKKSSR